MGDNLETWIEEFGPEFYIRQLEKMAKEWEKGIKILKEGLRFEKSDKFQKEIDIAEHIYFSFKSTANIIKFYLDLRKFKENKEKKWKEKIIKILREDLEITEKDRKIWKRNPEFGYHPEASENFIRESDFEYKIGILKKQIENLEKVK